MSWVILIWTRDNYGEAEPSASLVGTSREDLKLKLKQYLETHQTKEEEEENLSLNFMDLDKIVDEGGFELNYYFVSYLIT